MPKMPEVTVHVTTEPDPKETQEHKASADMWAEQCRTLQRTLLDTQIEREALRVRMERAQQGIGEGITRPHDAPEGCPTYYDGCNCTVEALVHNIERAEKAERRVAELEACNTRLLCERDDADGWAGRLADAIAAHMREDIGEHSNLNNPWANALELIDGTFCR